MCLGECRQLRRHREIGVQRKRGAVEHQFVLSADLVEIDQRQPAFGDPGHRDRQPHIVLVARIRRAVRHHQNFRAGLGETFDDVFVVLGFLQPDVLADRHPDPDAADGDGTGGRTAREQPLFVEHAVIRQVGLVADRRDAPAVEQRAGVIELAVLDPGAADQHGRAAVGGLPRQLLDGRAAGRLKGRFQHQIFRRIAGNEQFGQHHEIGAVGAALRARGAGLGGVAGDVAHRRVQLGQRDRKLIGSFGHGASLILIMSKSNIACVPRTSPDAGQTDNCMLQSAPMRSAMANSQNSPAITSATPTAAEPMSLTRPICGS